VVHAFRYFVGRSDIPAVERAGFEDDRGSITRAASELLSMPSRRAVEVWAGPRLVYHRARCGRGAWDDPELSA
jgi:hypothetical protein